MYYVLSYGIIKKKCLISLKHLRIRKCYCRLASDVSHNITESNQGKKKNKRKRDILPTSLFFFFFLLALTLYYERTGYNRDGGGSGEQGPAPSPTITGTQ